MPDPSLAESVGSSVRLEGVVKRYAGCPVLKGLDVAIPAGQFVAVVGRSGCGKSTLLRLVAGLESADSGRIHIGDSATDPRGTCVLFQEARLLPWKRVLDNVGLGLEGNWREAAGLALQQVGLESRARDWPATLSGGQRQRVALARAVVRRPGLLLLDEPLGALDALTRIEMQRLLENLWLRRRCTVLLVTHDVAEAVALADRILMLKDGAIAHDLPIALSRPRRRGSAEFAALEEKVLDWVLDGG
ncbi:ATP-binding cassette domain-containing protein [Methylococcus sp. EFPC2]|uniref:ATP-binding cassette domain-containing protein n=1 Tax=Methylococcus sp. EFPC2 TaxID=2812648 RepID=UPI0019688E2B|nr:ATP-binding cassette domain-containing protein [Methylococcus sp. EFPC2]QSA96118.1 ATP-binding cassette domain-containing protein [Methylococcus sp. EFPC2]